MRNIDTYLGSSPRKIDLNKLINQLIDDVDSVDKSDIPQGKKTAKYKALAKKFKNALFNDKRKFKGKGLNNRISLKTFSNYLSRTRKLFDHKLHHSFKKEVEKLCKKYPDYADIFKKWVISETSQIRIELSELKNKLNNGMILIEKYKHNSKNTTLIKNYPEWRDSIKNGTITDDVIKGENLLNDLNKIKVNHEIMYHLTLDKNEQAAIKIKSENSLKNKKRNTVTIDYKQYLNEIYKILSTPDNIFNDTQRKTLAPLAFALAAVSGRRMIEILLTGQFKRKNKYSVMFSGQAKKRTESENFEREIYTLIDSKLFIQKIKFLRSIPALDDIDEIIQKNIDCDRKIRNEKTVINAIFSQHLSHFTKQFFNDDRRVFKDSRSIYARIVYEKYFKTDKRWINVDEDVFFSEILGHDDDETQLHYKQFKLINFDPNYIPSYEFENYRLIALQKLDNDMPDLARLNAAVKIHQWVKEQISINPEANITTYSIRKALSVKPTVVARYMKHAASALELIKKDNGWFEKKVEQTSIVINDKQETEIIDEQDIKETISVEENNVKVDDNEQPQFTVQQLINKEWLVQYTLKGQANVWTGSAENVGDAINKALNNQKK